jgi:hypothetical protein
LASPLSSLCDGQHNTSDLTGALAYKLVRGSEIFPLGAEIGEPPWRVYKLWATGRLLGAWKDGRDLFASK